MRCAAQLRNVIRGREAVQRDEPALLWSREAVLRDRAALLWGREAAEGL